MQYIAATLLAAAVTAAACSGPDSARRSGPNPRLDIDAGQAPRLTENSDRTDELADALVGLRIRELLLEELKHEALGLQIGVEGAQVVLSGTVTRAWSRSRASAVAISVEGVEQVASLVEIVEAQESPESATGAAGLSGASAVATNARASNELADAVLLTRVKLRLAEALGADVLDLTVDVRDGVVSLAGVLALRHQRQQAIRSAGAVAGVREVRDLIEPADREEVSDRSRRAAGRDRSA